MTNLARYDGRIVEPTYPTDHKTVLREDYDNLAEAVHEMLGRIWMLEQRLDLLEKRNMEQYA